MMGLRRSRLDLRTTRQVCSRQMRGSVRTCRRQNKPPNRRRTRPHRRGRIAAGPVHKGRPARPPPMLRAWLRLPQSAPSCGGIRAQPYRWLAATFNFLSLQASSLQFSPIPQFRIPHFPFNSAATAVRPRTNVPGHGPVPVLAPSKSRRPWIRSAAREGGADSCLKVLLRATRAIATSVDFGIPGSRDMVGGVFLVFVVIILFFLVLVYFGYRPAHAARAFAVQGIKGEGKPRMRGNRTLVNYAPLAIAPYTRNRGVQVISG